MSLGEGWGSMGQGMGEGLSSGIGVGSMGLGVWEGSPGAIVESKLRLL